MQVRFKTNSPLRIINTPDTIPPIRVTGRDCSLPQAMSRETEKLSVRHFQPCQRKMRSCLELQRRRLGFSLVRRSERRARRLLIRRKKDWMEQPARIKEREGIVRERGMRPRRPDPGDRTATMDFIPTEKFQHSQKRMSSTIRPLRVSATPQTRHLWTCTDDDQRRSTA